MREVIITLMTRKTYFYKGCYWFKFNNLGLEIAMDLKWTYTSVARELKLKVRKFWGLSPTFVEVPWKKLVGGLFWVNLVQKIKIVS